MSTLDNVLVSSFRAYEAPRRYSLGYLRDRLAGEQGWRCCDCAAPMTNERVGEDQATIEHIVPRFIGGSDEEHNLAVVCLRCNRKESVEMNSLSPREQIKRIAARMGAPELGLMFADMLAAHLEAQERRLRDLTRAREQIGALQRKLDRAVSHQALLTEQHRGVRAKERLLRDTLVAHPWKTAFWHIAQHYIDRHRCLLNLPGVHAAMRRCADTIFAKVPQ